MIDFVKFNVLNPDIPKLRNNPLLEWEHVANERTGVIKEATACNHKMKFVITNEKYLRISGSIHQYWNSINTGIPHNYNDFTFSTMIETVKDFCSTFDLNPELCKLENIEFGVNIIPSIPADDILKSIIDHKGKEFDIQCSDKKHIRQCVHNRYIIKIYNKWIQYNRIENILRFEIKTMKMMHLNPIGIKTLADLFNHNRCKALEDYLVGTFYEIFFYDCNIDLDRIPFKASKLLSLGTSHIYWSNLKINKPHTYKKQRQRFRELVNLYGFTQIQEKVGLLIQNKWRKLISQRRETKSTFSNPLTREYTQINPSDKGLIQINNKETNHVCIGGGFLPPKEETDRKILPLHGKGREWKH